MGHLYRMIGLSHHILEKKGISPVFIISGYQETLNALNHTPFKYIVIDNKNETNELLEITSSSRKDLLLIDMQKKDDSLIKELTKKYVVISFDDTEGGARYSDIVFNSVFDVPMRRNNYFYGPEYFLIRPEIARYNIMEKNISNSVKKILICLGGSDPCSVNLLMTDWLKGLEFTGQIKWVLGPSVENKQDILKRIKNLNLDIIPLIDHKDMGKLYYEADLSVGAAGFGLYEAACVGLPVITVCLYPHQIKTARKFEENGCIVNLGYYKEIPEKSFKSSLCKLLKDQSRRSSMSKNGKMFVDGMGIRRVSDIMSEFI